MFWWLLQAVSDVHKQQQKVAAGAADDDDDDDMGGINIEQARRRMQEEDKFDKELYRQKIKQKHKVWHTTPDLQHDTRSGMQAGFQL